MPIDLPAVTNLLGNELTEYCPAVDVNYDADAESITIVMHPTSALLLAGIVSKFNEESRQVRRDYSNDGNNGSTNT